MSLTLRSNNATVAAVLVPDLGVLVPSGGGSETFSLAADIQAIRESADVRTLTSDGAFPGAADPSDHTLILLDSNGNEIAPDEVDFFLIGTGASGSDLQVRTYLPGVTDRSVVYVTGTGAVERAAASSVGASATVVGMVEAVDVPSVGKCLVRFNGDMDGFTGLTPGEIYILSTSPGGIVGETDTGNVNYPDTAPGSGHTLREVGVAVSSTTLFVDTQRDFEQI